MVSRARIKFSESATRSAASGNREATHPVETSTPVTSLSRIAVRSTGRCWKTSK